MYDIVVNRKLQPNVIEDSFLAELMEHVVDRVIAEKGLKIPSDVE